MVESSGQHLFLIDVVLPFKVAAYGKEHGYFINVPNNILSSIVIISVFFVLAVVSMRRREARFMDYETGLIIRGIAIIFLLLGHLSVLILDRPVFSTAGGPLAVIAFLFLSGFGIQKRYGLTPLKWEFWKKRVMRLVFSLWGSLALFFLLDYLIYRRAYTATEKVLPFLFIIVPDHNGVNSSAWFVTFILFNYLAYFVASRLNVRIRLKVVSIFAVTAAVFILLTFREFRITELWRQYLVVFPLGVFLAFALERFPLDKSLENRYILILLLAILSVITYFVSSRYALLRPFSLVLVILVLGKLLFLSGYTSRFLEFLGRHSYEIFLLHLPLMERFDFVLYQWPIHISFFVYFAIVTALAVMLSRMSGYLNNIVLKIKWFSVSMVRRDAS